MKKSKYNIFGTYIKREREKKRLTLKNVSEKILSWRSFLSELENNKRPAPRNISLLERFSDTLGVPLDVLIASSNNDHTRRDLVDLKNIFLKEEELAIKYCELKDKLTPQEFEELLIRILKKGLNVK